MPVRWRETLLALRELGAQRFIDVGPGRVLSGLAKRTLKDVELVHA
jgi:[acyl-carrier-protein] S-malonyltransferase